MINTAAAIIKDDHRIASCQVLNISVHFYCATIMINNILLSGHFAEENRSYHILHLDISIAEETINCPTCQRQQNMCRICEALLKQISKNGLSHVYEMGGMLVQMHRVSRYLLLKR